MRGLAEVLPEDQKEKVREGILKEYDTQKKLLAEMVEASEKAQSPIILPPDGSGEGPIFPMG